RSGRLLGLVLLTCLTAQVVAVLLLVRPGAFWSPDSAVRFVQVESLLRSHYRDLAVPYPAASIDPEGRYFPLGGWFHFQRTGRFYLSYLPYFSIASAPLYRLFGPPGLLLIPAASVLGTVWITYGVLRRRAPAVAGAGALALGLGTPLFIYGVVFWDHSLAVLLSAGALAILGVEAEAPRPGHSAAVAAAGALLAMGFWLRSEMYLLALAAGAGWVVAVPRGRSKGLIALACGGALPAACLWIANARLFGSPLGWKGQDLIATRMSGAAHAAAGGWAGWVSEKLGNAYYQLISPDFYAFNPPAVATGVAVGLALLLAGVLIRMGVGRRSIPAIVSGTVLGAGTAVWIATGRTAVSGLLPASPLVVLALLRGSGSPWERFLWVTTGLFGAAVIATGTHGGLQWGPRYLLPILPVLVWLAASALAQARAAAFQTWPALRAAAVALLAASMLVQASGVDQVWQAIRQNARINQWLRGIPAEIVVTPLEWLTLGAGPVYFEKQLMLVHSPVEFKALVERLSAGRVGRWAYIPYSGPAFLRRSVEQWTADRPWRFRVDDDRTWNGLRFVTFAGSPHEVR
ncbi:MAG TPA: hypothetical protein VEW91_08265, partial [bacterium]|nr:hypothetical protein [bacterium]